MTLDIGLMRDRVTVKFVEQIENGRGGWTQNETDVGEFWAFIEPLKAFNIVQYRQADMNVTTKITMRYNASINNHCVFYARGNKYLIEEIIADRQNRFLTILAIGEKFNGS